MRRNLGLLIISENARGLIHAISLLLCLAIIGACDYKPETFFGQRIPGLEPIPFAHDILTNQYRPHGRMTFSPDNTELYWEAFTNDKYKRAIFSSRLDDGVLSIPEFAPFADTFYYGGPSYSWDGQKIYFWSNKPHGDTIMEEYSGIWCVERQNNSWSQPELIFSDLDSPISYKSVCATKKGDLFLVAKGPDDSSPIIYISEYDEGAYKEPVPLKGDIESFSEQSDVYVDPDEKFVMFSSIVTKEKLGLTDIFISFKLDDKTWGKPVNLGPIINSEHIQRFPSFSRDGKYFFFVRMIGIPYNKADVRYYWVKAEALKDIFEKAGH
ncbi:MAG: hypothetical protein V3V99_13830 [candidate division Zixibacteria bacterium]